MTNDEIAAVRPDALAGAQIVARAEAVGKTKAQMPASRAFLLAVLAGLFIGMGGMFMLLVKSDASLGFAASSLLGALAFSVGLFLVLVAGAELFTGNNLMVLGLLSGRYSPASLLRSWAVVYAGNLVGSLLLVALLLLADYASMNGGAVGETMVSVAAAKCSLPWDVAFGRAIMCNILVCLAVWMGFAARTVVDRFLCAALPVTAFVACGFEHCVANMFFLPMGLLAHAAGVAPEGANLAALTMGGLLSNLSAATLGNMVGGAAFLAGTYWLAYRKGHGVCADHDEGDRCPHRPACRKGQGMYGLKTEVSFDSAHFLTDYYGTCESLHGHRWRVVAYLEQDGLHQEGTMKGMVLDFGVFKQAVREVADSLDHTFLVEEGSLAPSTLAALESEGFSLTVLPFRTTAENLACWFFEQLAKRGLPVSQVDCYETPNNCAIYRP